VQLSAALHSSSGESAAPICRPQIGKSANRARSAQLSPSPLSGHVLAGAAQRESSGEQLFRLASSLASRKRRRRAKEEKIKRKIEEKGALLASRWPFQRVVGADFRRTRPAMSLCAAFGAASAQISASRGRCFEIIAPLA